MKKASFAFCLICLGIISLAAQSYPLPITQYDYATVENNVSPIAIGMGGLNLTDERDPYISYSNPALLAELSESKLVTSFRLSSEKQLSFAEAASISNALKDKQFKYFSLATQKFGFSYQPMSRINISEVTPQNYNLYYDFALDKVQLSIAAQDDKWANLSGGLNLKYLSGRLVYLKERRIGSQTFQREVFIDNKVKGFSTDLGIMLDQESFRIGLVGYDILSRLFWESYKSKPIQPRIGISTAYKGGDMLINAGVMGKMSQSTDTTYHLGFQNDWNWGASQNSMGKSVQHTLTLRMGLYSHDFYGAQNIHFTMGSGYNYSVFRFDFSINSAGMKLKESEYLFSLGLGLP